MLSKDQAFFFRLKRKIEQSCPKAKSEGRQRTYNLIPYQNTYKNLPHFKLQTVINGFDKFIEILNIFSKINKILDYFKYYKANFSQKFACNFDKNLDHLEKFNKNIPTQF